MSTNESTEYKSRNQLDMNWTQDKYWSERVAVSKADKQEVKKAYIKGYGNGGANK